LKKDKRPQNTPALEKARVLELLAAGANKRDLAKKLGLKGSDRILLKRILKELQAEGAIEGSPKKGFTRRGELPETGLIEVTGLDDDGEMLARPLNWESNDEPPRIYVTPPKDGGSPALGDRLLARLERHGEAYEARIIRRLDRETQTRLSVCFAIPPPPGGGWCRSTKRRAPNMRWIRPISMAPSTMSWSPPNPSPAALPVSAVWRSPNASAAWIPPRPSA